MLKILWVEDQLGGKQTEWFGNRPVTVITNFDDAEKTIINDIEKFDLVVLDINLEESGVTENINKHAKAYDLDTSVFLKECGMTLFLTLLENGFPKERIVFLTANSDEKTNLLDKLQSGLEQKDFDLVDSILAEIQNGLGEEQVNECQKLITAGDINLLIGYLKEYFEDLNKGTTPNTYDSFCAAYKRCRIKPPEAINKNLQNVKEYLVQWLNGHENNQYLVLRRGIIDGCGFLKSHTKKDDSNIQFRDFIKLDNNKKASIEIPTTEIENYLDALIQSLVIREPIDESALNIQYRLFLRALVHVWEENIDPNKKYNYNDINTFAWLSKMTRNWTSHSNLLEPLNPQIIAFLFMVNMRAMFKIPPETQSFEDILLSCISTSKEIDESLENKIEALENNINNTLLTLKIPEYKEDKNGNRILDKYDKEKMKDFGNKINAIHQKNTGNVKQHDFQDLLRQYFWVNQKPNLDNLMANSDDFLPTLARHIYSLSFS
ncbi:MAG: hypothetical protein Q8N35_15595 [Methylococcaceae bacterium]|nr:hypothetical protein [Methylococcaceae bacterium]MDZ4157214.1 hypothetical protein [Methylococcales bacterium]MDP2392503.1 hypothetical protein [Methylococcaceae bacterium]MDP3021004.1 hypothetical protein [Methylococcaceae bacterium]MDP3388391.1 hypothetical protein [Methylococcaceae bacterium]